MIVMSDTCCRPHLARPLRRVCEHGVDNDATLANLGKQASPLSRRRLGGPVRPPRQWMDKSGWLRRALDAAGFYRYGNNVYSLSSLFFLRPSVKQRVPRVKGDRKTYPNESDEPP